MFFILCYNLLVLWLVCIWYSLSVSFNTVKTISPSAFSGAYFFVYGICERRFCFGQGKSYQAWWCNLPGNFEAIWPDSFRMCFSRWQGRKCWRSKTKRHKRDSFYVFWRSFFWTWICFGFWLVSCVNLDKKDKVENSVQKDDDQKQFEVARKICKKIVQTMYKNRWNQRPDTEFFLEKCPNEHSVKACANYVNQHGSDHP